MIFFKSFDALARKIIALIRVCLGVRMREVVTESLLFLGRGFPDLRLKGVWVLTILGATQMLIWIGGRFGMWQLSDLWSAVDRVWIDIEG